MRAFIYDKYGYYPPEEYATSFEYKGWFFKLEISEKTDAEIHHMRFILYEVNQLYENLGSDILLTRDGHYVSNSEYGPVVLIAVKNGEVNLDTLIKMHQQFFNHFSNTKLLVSHLRNLWIHKVDTIKERILSSLPIDEASFKQLEFLGEYALGVAENAIQYLLDSAFYYGNEVVNTTICHKRLDELNSFYLFNPFNYVIDSPMRDYGELYRHGLIRLEDLYQALKSYPLSGQDASLLLARILYPSEIFDILEDYYELKKDVQARVITIYNDFDNRIYRLKKIHQFLVKRYSIRPINWLS